MTLQRMTPDLPYPMGVTGTNKPLALPLEDWFRAVFANRGRLVALSVVRSGARHYSLNHTWQATGVAYAAWGVKGQVVAEIYPFHEAAESNDDAHNFFWQVIGEEQNPTYFDACPLEILMALTPAATPEAYKWRRECARNYPPHVFPQLHEHLQLVFPREGARWRLKANVERFPHFIAEKGMAGVIDEVGEDLISLKLDDSLPGAEPWDNCIWWSPDNTDGAVLWEFLLECERVEEPAQGRETP